MIERSGEFKLLSSEYVNYDNPLIIKHLLCGNSFKASFSSFKAKQTCPYCYNTKFKGENKIRSFLIENKIKFIPQYRIPECKYKRTLPFDFAIINNKKDLLGLIEYDGKGHFVELKRSKNENKNMTAKKKKKIRDSIKNSYCLKNNIPLLRISYKELDNYKEKLKPFINKISTTIEILK